MAPRQLSAVHPTLRRSHGNEALQKLREVGHAGIPEAGLWDPAAAQARLNSSRFLKILHHPPIQRPGSTALPLPGSRLGVLPGLN